MLTCTPSLFTTSEPLPKIEPLKSSVSLKLPTTVGLKLSCIVVESEALINTELLLILNGAAIPVRVKVCCAATVLTKTTSIVVVLSTVVGVKA